MRRDARAISTVVDVSLALLLVSASVATFVLFTEPDSETHRSVEADRTAEMLAATTIRVDYSLYDVTEEPAWAGESYSPGDSAVIRRTHGPVTELLAEAAIAKVRVDSTDVFVGGDDFEEKLEGDARDIFTSSDVEAHAVAVWRPYENAGIEGRAEVGPEPPEGADVSVATMTIDSGVPSVDDGTIASRYESDGFGGAARVIARAIVRGYFPPGETQTALEGSGFQHHHARYRYVRMKEVFNDWHGTSVSHPNPAVNDGVSYDFGLTGSYVSEASPDATAANERLLAEMERDVERDLQDKYDSSISGPELADRVSTGEVRIVIRTWTER